MTKRQNPRPTAVDGQLAAASVLGRTSMHPDVTEVISDYKRLASEEARAAFADHFLSRTAGMMEEIWPAFYELLKRIEDQRLYEKPGYLVTDHQFGSFKDYWDYRVGQPFETWLELESTYQYAKRYAPDLLKKAFSIARSAKERATQGARALAEAAKAGMIINDGPGPVSREEREANGYIISIKDGLTGGTRAEYLARRIARDHPDVLDRMAAGEFPSITRAAIAAGITPRTQTIRIDDPGSAARTLRKHMPREALARLVELLTKEDQ